MTTNQDVKNIRRMTALELLNYILENPEYLTDSYYMTMGTAVRERVAALAREAV